MPVTPLPSPERSRSTPVPTALALLLALAACVPAAQAPPAPVSAAPQPASPPPQTLPPAQAMLPTRTIAANAQATASLSQLSAAIAAAGLTDMLAGTGPVTLFAPTDAAFARLSPDALRSLTNPENRTTLARVLRYHIVPGTITTADLLARIRAGDGSAALQTLAGVPIRISRTADVVTLTSETGNKSYIEVADLRQANGMVQVVNGVLIPALD